MGDDDPEDPATTAAADDDEDVEGPAEESEEASNTVVDEDLCIKRGLISSLLLEVSDKSVSWTVVIREEGEDEE